MSEKEKKREITVKAPHLNRREEALLEDTTEAERLKIFEFSKRTGRILSGGIITVGIILFLFSINALLGDTLGFLSLKNWFTPEMKLPFIAFLGSLGVINTLCGLILLTKE